MAYAVLVSRQGRSHDQALAVQRNALRSQSAAKTFAPVISLQDREDGMARQEAWDRFNDQFRETFGETQERWREIKARRKAEGKCWQCAKPIFECECPNVKHDA